MQSILRPSQRWLLRGFLAGALVLVANAAFLLLFRLAELTDAWSLPRDTLPAFYQSMVLGHTLLGLLLAPVSVVFAVWHLGRAWDRRHASALWTGSGLIAFMLALVATGFFILSEANSRDNRFYYWTHIGLGVAMPLVYVVHRVTSTVPPAGRAVGKAFGFMAGLAVVLLGVHLVTLPAKDAREVADDVITQMATVRPQEELLVAEDPFLPFQPFGEIPRESPFWPSAATTATGGLMPSRVVTRGELPDPEALAAEVEAYGFVKDHRIGAETCARCHADIVEQWATSAHRFSSMNNPFYRKPFMDLRDSPQNRELSQFCSGCHEPALMQAGEVKKEFDPDSANAQAGLTCLACHAIDAIHNNTGNGNYNIPDHKESPYLFDGTRGGLGRLLGDILLKAKPTVHKQQMLKDSFRTSEYCASCHKVHLGQHLNDYRWLRAQNEYDNWHDSGVSRNAARTFYLPAEARNCQDCHMPPEEAPLGDVSAKNGKVRSHRFLSVNTALPAVRGDTDTLRRIKEFLRDRKMRVDLFVLRRLDDEGNETEWIPALSRNLPALKPGERVEVQVVVRNQGVGHTFPGGTNDSNQGWIDFQVQGADGSVWFHSGALDEKRYLDPTAERYGTLMLDHDGEVADKRNAPDFHVAVYNKVIGPGTADLVRYQFQVPEDAVGEVRLSAYLTWRKFNRGYLEYVFEGEEVPDLPITRIAGEELVLPVASSPTPAVRQETAEDWVKFNDLGIALLLDGDTRGAARAFEQVAKVAPERVDGPRNLARVMITEGSLEAAYEHLAKAQELAPTDAQNAWVWGNLLVEDGRFPEAVEAYRYTLQVFPEDRDTWARLGRALYLDEQFPASLEAFLKVLRIDPESANAHYHRMLCYRGMGEADKAAEAEKAYLMYKLDEDADALSREYRLGNPEAQRLSQPIHVHELQRLPEGD